MRVLDSIHENGAKLIEALPSDIPALRNSTPGVRIIPEVFYFPAVVAPPLIARRVKLATAVAPSVRIELNVVDARTGAGVRGATVVAFTDLATETGAQGTTNAQGKVQLSLGAGSKKLELLYVSALDFWPFLKTNVVVRTSSEVKLEPIVFPFIDCVRHAYGQSDLTAGAGVKVAVIDSGVGPHPDLTVEGGQNTVTGENPADFSANGPQGHGTHVAGIIAARGAASTGTRGVAPGVILRSYRVFGKGADRASNFAIAKAIDAAVADKCDLINMSLGGGPEDPLTSEAIAGARAAGCVVLAANGNDGRQPVSFPAAFDRCLAVSAMGRKKTFPAKSAIGADVAKPSGTDAADFMASFSNIGEDTDLTGPGVGVISTVPGGYGIMSGTSMACPAATGALARLLAADQQVLRLPRTEARSNAIIELMNSHVSSLGFGPLFEGRGRIDP
jgi:subtilisin